MESIGDPWKRGNLGPLRSQMRHNIPSEMKPRGIEKPPPHRELIRGKGSVSWGDPRDWLWFGLIARRHPVPP